MVSYQGRVQGVGFRATTRSLARGHAVTGWVRNEPDASVRVEVQGAASEIDAFLANVRSSLGLYIQRESAEAMPLAENESGFEVHR